MKRHPGLMALNGDTERRETLLAEAETGLGEYGGIRSFIGMRPETLAALVEEEFLRPDDRQNESPTVAEFLAYMQENEGITAIGYAVVPDRNDYRVSIEGLVLAKPHTAEQEASFRGFCDGADELFETDSEVGHGLRAWWD